MHILHRRARRVISFAARTVVAAGLLQLQVAGGGKEERVKPLAGLKRVWARHLLAQLGKV